MAPGVMKFQRKFWWFNWSLSTASTAGFWRYMSIALSDMPNNSEIVNLFDQFKITGVRYEFHPRYDSFAGNDTGDITPPNITNQGGNVIHVVNDPKSVLLPSGTYNTTTLNSFMEQGKVRTHRGTRPVVIYHRPCIATPTSGISNSQQVRAPWLLTSTGLTVAHTGAHVFFQDPNLTGASGQNFDVFVTLYVLCRGAR